jgi:predicted dehydrogenase
MSSELSAGFVGLGWIAGQHLDILSKLGGVRVTAVSDADEARAAEVGARVGAKTYHGWEELLDAGKADLLWVCIPPGAHRDPAVGALERGVHVYLEKPIARTPDQAAAIVAAAQASEAVCAVGYQWHALDLLEPLRSALDGQAIGMVITSSYGPTLGRSWFLNRAQSGGNLLERGSHNIDLLRAVAGDVDAVQATGSTVSLAQAAAPSKGDIEDGVGVLLRLRGGGVAALAVAWLKDGQPGRYTLEVLADDATLRLNLDPDFTLEGVSRGPAVNATSVMHPLESSVARFLDAARAGDKALVACRPADAARTLQVVVACEQAMATGELVEVAQ